MTSEIEQRKPLTVSDYIIKGSNLLSPGYEIYVSEMRRNHQHANVFYVEASVSSYYTVKYYFILSRKHYGLLEKSEDQKIIMELMEEALTVGATLKTLDRVFSEFETESYDINIKLAKIKDDSLNLLKETFPRLETFSRCFNIQGATLPRTDISCGNRFFTFQSLKTKTSEDKDFAISMRKGEDFAAEMIMREALQLEAEEIVLKEDKKGLAGDMKNTSRISEEFQVIDSKANEYPKLSEAMKNYKKESRQNVLFDNPQEFPTINAFTAILYWLEKSCLPKYVVIGSCWGQSYEWSKGGTILHDFSYERGLFAQKVYGVLLEAVGINAESSVISPLAGLTKVAVFHILALSGFSWKNISSVFCEDRQDKPTLEGEAGCGVCFDCLKVKAVLNYLNGRFSKTYPKSVVKGMPEPDKLFTKMSPSTFFNSAVNNETFHTIMGRPGKAINDSRVLQIFNSDKISQFCGGTNVFDDVVAYLEKDCGMEVFSSGEPKPPASLELVLVKDALAEVFSLLSIENNPWSELKGMIDASEKIGVVENPVCVPIPFERMICEYYEIIGGLYSHFTKWIFYGDKGKIIKVSLAYPEKVLESLIIFNDVVPEFDSPIVRGHLSWDKDKINLLNSFVREGLIESWEIA